MKKLLTFITSTIVAGALFYILHLIFTNLAASLLATFESAPSPKDTLYGSNTALVAAALLAFYSWIKLYRYMNKPQVI